MDKATTIVTACNRRFLWGTYLLATSLRFSKMTQPLHVMTYGLTPAENRLLEQFDSVHVFPSNGSGKFGVTLKKPEALLTANSEFIAWLDADSIVTGDVTRYLAPLGESFQIRFREPRENVLRFKTPQYALGEDRTAVPKSVLEAWREDVGERTEPAMTATCSANCFTLHRRYLDFVRRWKDQIVKLAPRYAGVQESPYTYGGRMSDELILNSLLMFVHDPPKLSKYRLDTDPHAYLAHFGVNPKPWSRWQPKHLKYFDSILSMLDWCMDKGYETPPIPISFKRDFKGLIAAASHVEHLLRKAYYKLRGQKREL